MSKNKDQPDSAPLTNPSLQSLARSLRTSSFAVYQDLFLRLKDPAFLVHSESYKTLDLNAPAEKLLEKLKLPDIGPDCDSKPLELLTSRIAPRDSLTFEKHLRIAKRKYYPHEWEWVCTTVDDGLMFILVSVCRITLNNQDDVLQVILQDQTKARVAELKLEQYVEELESLNKKLDELSRTDGLTGLTNIRTFKETLELEHNRCARYGGSYSIVMLDADFFKNYNDKNGHQAGDVLLKSISSIIQKNCRKTDYPARYGGEEFIILCSAVLPEQALTLAERIRHEIVSSTFPHQHLQPNGVVTISAGVAGFPKHGQTTADVIAKADQALFQAKAKGRNQCVSA